MNTQTALGREFSEFYDDIIMVRNVSPKLASKLLEDVRSIVNSCKQEEANDFLSNMMADIDSRKEDNEKPKEMPLIKVFPLLGVRHESYKPLKVKTFNSLNRGRFGDYMRLVPSMIGSVELVDLMNTNGMGVKCLIFAMAVFKHYGIKIKTNGLTEETLFYGHNLKYLFNRADEYEKMLIIFPGEEDSQKEDK